MPDVPDRNSGRRVVDSANNRLVFFDPTNYEYFGPVSHGEDFSPDEDGFLFSVVEWLYRSPSGKWLRTEERFFNLGPADTIETLYRLDEIEAAEWLIDAGLPVPTELKPVLTSMTFDPDAAVPVAPNESPERRIPGWDKGTFKLWYCGKVVREVRPIAENVIKVLDDFQELGWPERIDSPFLPGEAKRGEAIKQLNIRLSVIRFAADGSGEGIRWFVSESVDDVNENGASPPDDVPF